MVVGDLVILSNCQTTGYTNGEIGIVTKIERVGQLFRLYWVFMSDGIEVPMWATELEVFNGDRGSYYNFEKSMGYSITLWLQERRPCNGFGNLPVPNAYQPTISKSFYLCLRKDSCNTNIIHSKSRRVR